MNKNKSNDPKIVNWEYLPDSTTLIEYLDRVDVVELGKCCKRYRKQFEKIIFDMLNLTSYLNKNKVTTKELNKSKDYDELTRAIKEDLGDKLNLVKKFKFNDIFCLGYLTYQIAGIANHTLYLFLVI
ncbi:hypothetical protein CONCODRAFT_12130 [Conidiobolus coronatus NRRL 28638]|uniref:Uncharacterized protein n=1 Tax=Conidiobolus coronatus (strain ATCC 28846 / CBS 209.66 / NRRL 28638) TaxID=796925 RepID=A0A137NTP8_CONC2|nr:hypothetical protein CONCODRAFT_12130 [Conidiobolus coronatus NRRL 28638]|eukprot:KXN66096.1 hypothetical protein CONCODRAFT_12130 [Conidiobolus coronatus NRRL 28638]